MKRTSDQRNIHVHYRPATCRKVNLEELKDLLRQAVHRHGIADIARTTALSKHRIRRALRPGYDPPAVDILLIVRAVGWKWGIQPIEAPCLPLSEASA
jgi:DNA-binding phage protein